MHENISDNMFQSLSTHLNKLHLRRSTIPSLISSQRSSIIEMQTYKQFHNTSKASTDFTNESRSVSTILLCYTLFNIIFFACLIEILWNIFYIYYIHTEDARFILFRQYYDDYDLINALIAFLIMTRSLQLQIKQAKTSIKSDNNNRISNTYQHFRANLFLTFVVTFYYGLLATGIIFYVLISKRKCFIIVYSKNQNKSRRISLHIRFINDSQNMSYLCSFNCRFKMG